MGGAGLVFVRAGSAEAGPGVVGEGIQGCQAAIGALVRREFLSRAVDRFRSGGRGPGISSFRPQTYSQLSAWTSRSRRRSVPRKRLPSLPLPSSRSPFQTTASQTTNMNIKITELRDVATRALEALGATTREAGCGR